MKTVIYLLSIVPLVAFAGGSNYGITPGAHPNLAGKVSEWPVPTPRFARDPAIAPHGSDYIAVMTGNKVARFDTKEMTAWGCPVSNCPSIRKFTLR
jgi:virginiamycin B lyase